MNAIRMVQAAAVALILPAGLEAHSGGLDARCGHTDRRTDSYHTHTNGECWKRLTAERARQIQAEEARRPPERSDAQWRADMRRLARQTTGKAAAAAGRGTRAVQDHVSGDTGERRAAPVVEDGATFLSDQWRLSRHGSWSAGTTEDGAAVIFTTAADGRQLEVHCSPGDPEGRPEHAYWVAAVMSDGEYFVSGPPEDRRAALLLGTGARLIAQSAARGGQPVELLLGDEHKTFATAGADRAAARSLAADTACDWTSDVDLTFDAPSTDGLRAGGMALVRDGDEAAPADGGTRLVVLDEGRVVLAFAGALLLALGAFEARRWWRERRPRAARAPVPKPAPKATLPEPPCTPESAPAPGFARECGTMMRRARKPRQASGAPPPPAPACCLCGKGPVLGYCACTPPPEVEARTAALLRDPYGREREGNGPLASTPTASEAERAARRRSAETRAAAKRRDEDERKALFTRRAEPERAEKRGSASGTGPPVRRPPARGGPASAVRRRGAAWPEREALPATD